MVSQIQYELKKTLLAKEFWIAFLVSSLLVNASFMYEAFTRSRIDVFYSFSPLDSYIGAKYNWAWEIYAGLWPFLIVLSSATFFLNEKTSKSLGSSIRNSSYRTFFYAKIISAGLCSMLVIGIPMLINLLQCYLIFPHSHNAKLGTYQLLDYSAILLGKTTMYEHGGNGFPFLSLYLYSPFLYACLFLILLLLFSGLCGAFVTSLSFNILKRKIQLFIPIYVLNFSSLKAKDFFFAKVMNEVRSYPLNETTIFPVHTTKYYDLYLMDYFCVLGVRASLPVFIIGIAAFLLAVTLLCTELAISQKWELIQ